MATDTVEPRSVGANDPEVREAGMNPLHAARLSAFAQGAYRACGGRKLLIIVRGSDPLSLAHQGRENHFPKPPTIEAKIGVTGRGRRKIDGRHYISDYDLQGVYELRHDGGYMRLYVSNLKKGDKTDASDPRMHVGDFKVGDNLFLKTLNDVVCPGLNLFQHGPNDDYMKAGVMGRTPGEDEVFLAFKPEGGILLIKGRSALRRLYSSHGISWNYRA